MSWQTWDQLRKQRAELRGKWTSKEGTEKLAKVKVTLHPDRSIINTSVPEAQHDVTRVRRDGKTIGMVDHPDSKFGVPGRFQTQSFRPTVTAEYGPTKSVDHLGDFTSHDAAVEAVLKAHDVTPPKISSATVLAERVSGPQKVSTVAGPYEGKRAAPEKGMSGAAKQADSIATRIRMNAGRTDPMTGEKLTTDTRSANKLAAKVDRPLSFDRVKKVYGGLIKIHRTRSGGQSVIDRHMSGMAVIPLEHHQLIREHLAGHPDGGIHIGNGLGIDMKGTKVSRLHESGVQILRDRPNEQANGVYSSDVRQLVAGNGGDEHDRPVATTSHELGHAVDNALGEALSGRKIPASDLPHFRQVFSEVTHMHDNSKTLLNPYFTGGSRNSEESGRKEMFAEAYGAWADGRTKYKDPDERSLLIGHAIGAAPSEKLRVGKVLRNYFDVQDQKIRDMRTD